LILLSLNKIILTVVSAILFYLIFAIYSDINIIQNYFLNIDLSYIFPIFSILLFSQFIRSLSQKFILKKLDIEINVKDSFILFLTGLSMIITPGGSGQIIKSHFLKEKFNEPITKSLPLVFVERFVDLIVISIIIFITLFVVGFLFESVIAIILSLIMMIFFLSLITNKKILGITFKIFSKIKFLKNIFPDESLFSESFQNIFKPKILFISSLMILVSFILEGIIIYFGFLSFGVDLGMIESIQFYYTSLLYGALSFVPAGLGITEGSLATLLSKEISSIALITSIIIFIRLTTIWFSSSLGMLVAYFQIYRKN
jgi:uncharacterized protein (TIRG00374 family)|tara:strand:- start:3942 stop:4883 length:942 start_codon:yes stop_codon:yes gene_type:complete